MQYSTTLTYDPTTDRASLVLDVATTATAMRPAGPPEAPWDVCLVLDAAGRVCSLEFSHASAHLPASLAGDDSSVVYVDFSNRRNVRPPVPPPAPRAQ